MRSESDADGYHGYGFDSGIRFVVFDTKADAIAAALEESEYDNTTYEIFGLVYIGATAECPLPKYQFEED